MAVFVGGSATVFVGGGCYKIAAKTGVTMSETMVASAAEDDGEGEGVAVEKRSRGGRPKAMCPTRAAGQLTGTLITRVTVKEAAAVEECMKLLPSLTKSDVVRAMLLLAHQVARKRPGALGAALVGRADS